MITTEYFGHYNGKAVFEFRLTNNAGNYVELTNYGAIVKSIFVPDANGIQANIVLGYPSFKGYLFDKCYIGATVGPFANRIANAAFSIDDKSYNLDQNDNKNNNHSGSAGFNNKVFDFIAEDNRVTFSLHSPDGEGGFPGNLNAKITYRWTDDSALIIEFSATTDKPSPVNFTNHSYFNLSGCAETIHNHELEIKASKMLQSTPDHIPSGKIAVVGNYGFHGQYVGKVIKAAGLNNYYIFDSSDVLYNNCTLKHTKSGRIMEVYTTYPGVQLYTGDYLSGGLLSAHGAPYKPFDGLCLECHFYPDSPNHPHFPNTILRPDERFNHSIIYKFSTLQPISTNTF